MQFFFFPYSLVLQCLKITVKLLFRSTKINQSRCIRQLARFKRLKKLEVIYFDLFRKLIYHINDRKMHFFFFSNPYQLIVPQGFYREQTSSLSKNVTFSTCPSSYFPLSQSHACIATARTQSDELIVIILQIHIYRISSIRYPLGRFGSFFFIFFFNLICVADGFDFFWFFALLA